ncbi:MAG: hypothetical protein A4E55_00373 [Pelotomaculum sp. PtaU1.Bin035]|nr:MAG: hypothetical protein A4E55_00373 [Pelotomaculum sp. PtaU1.Bin035]
MNPNCCPEQPAKERSPMEQQINELGIQIKRLEKAVEYLVETVALPKGQTCANEGPHPAMSLRDYVETCSVGISTICSKLEDITCALREELGDMKLLK